MKISLIEIFSVERISLNTFQLKVGRFCFRNRQFFRKSLFFELSVFLLFVNSAPFHSSCADIVRRVLKELEGNNQ